MIERGADGGNLVGPALRKPQQSKARLGTRHPLASMKQCFPLNPWVRSHGRRGPQRSEDTRRLAEAEPGP